jgi:hypothetical protein
MIAFVVTLVLFTLVGTAAVNVFRLTLPRLSFSGGIAFRYLLGVAAYGIVLFATALCGIPLTRATVVVLAAIAVPGLWGRRNQWQDPLKHPILPTLIFLVPVCVLLWAAAALPIRDYDGRVTWLPKARAIAHEHVIDGKFFRGEAGLNLHNRYPLLIPLDVAAIMLLIGDLENESARWLYVLIAISALVVARDLLTVAYPCAGPWVIAGVVWLPVFLAIEGGALAAYNDVTMLAFIGVAVLCLHSREEPSIGAAAMFMAALVLTKNEGPVAVMAIFVSALFTRKVTVRECVTMLGPTAAAFGGFLLWRHRVPPAYDEQYDVLVRSLPQHASRVAEAGQALLTHALDRTEWGWFWPVTAVAITIALLSRRRKEVLLPLGVMILILGAYTVTFAVTSWNIAELASVAASRLLLHVVIPACCLLAAAAELLIGDGGGSRVRVEE